MAINPEVIEGTPTTAGASSGINISATNAVSGPVNSGAFPITIDATPPADTAPSFTETPAAPTAKIDTAYHWPIGTIITGTRPITLSGTLPAGLTFADGSYPEAITGTPTAEGTTNTAITATNSQGADTSAALDIEVRGLSHAPLWFGVPSPPNARLGVEYSYAIGVLIEGDRPMTLTDVGDPLPEGLSYDVSSYPERIVGTPTEDGSFTIVTSASNDV